MFHLNKGDKKTAVQFYLQAIDATNDPEKKSICSNIINGLKLSKESLNEIIEDHERLESK